MNGITTFANSSANGSVALTKNGTGTFTLTGANTYTGPTTVNRGTLALNFDTQTSNVLGTSAPLTLGGGTLLLTGANTATQTVNGLTTTANTSSGILLNANKTLTLLALTFAGANSALNFNTAAGGAVVILTGQSAGNVINTGYTVTDSTGFGLATVNGSNNVVRYTTATALPDSGATSPTNYLVDSASGNLTLTTTTTQSAGTITVDTTGGAGTLTVGSGFNLSNNVWSFGAASGTNTYAINGGDSTGKLTAVADGSTINFNNYNPGTLTLGVVISNVTAASNVVFGGTGTAVITGINTYTGKTFLNGGVTQITVDNNFGTAPGSAVTDQLTFNGGTLQLAAGFNLATTRGLTLNGSGGTIDTNTFASIYAGVIAGAGALTKSGTGTLTLSAAQTNTFTGSTIVNAGTLVERNSSTAGYNRSSATTTINSGGTLLLDMSAETGANQNHDIKPITVNAGGTLDLRSTINNVDGSYFSAGSVTGAGTITKSGVGVVEFFGGSSIKNFSGQINITQGVLATNGSDWNTSAGLMNMDIASGAAFDIRTGGIVINNLTGTGTVGSSSGPGLLTVGNNNGSSTFSGVLRNSGTFGGVGAGVLSLTKAGTGTLTLTGANTFTGATTVSNGILTLNPGGTLANSNTITIASGTTLNLSGSANNQLVAGTTNGTLTISGTLNATTNFAHTLSNGTSYFATLTMNNGTLANTFGQNTSGFGAFFFGTSRTITANGSNNTIAGLGVIGLGTGVVLTLSTPLATDAINFTGAINNGQLAGGIAKTGLGTVTLSGANIYTGITTINGGTLIAASTGGQALGSTSGITIATGGTLALGASNQINNSATMTLSGGTLSLRNSFSEGSAGTAGLGTLNHTATSTLDFGTTSPTIQNVQFNAVGTHTPDTVLNVTNYDNGTDHLYFTGANALAFTSAYNQADVTFNGAAGYSITQSSTFFEVTPVPEPGTILGLAAAGMGIAGWVRRRRQGRS